MLLAIMLATSTGAYASLAAGEGDYRALMVTIAVPMADVERLLPAGLSLGKQNFTTEGTHPMVFAFGNQSGVHPHFPFPKVFNLTYLEFIHTIPFVVQCEDGSSGCRGPFLFSPRLYLDQLAPTALGWAYGLAKHVVQSYSSTEGKQVIGHPEGPLVQATWSTTGPYRPPHAMPTFAPLAAIMETQPMIGVQELTGGFECSRFNWGLQTRATIAPATGVAQMTVK